MSLAMDTGEAALGPTRQLVKFVCELGYDDLDEATRHAARRHIFDTLGASVAGSGQRVSEIAEAVLADAMAAGAVPVPGRARRADMLSAAYLAGASAHGLELDDGYRNGSIHCGAVVVPAALAMAYTMGASGAAFLLAVVAGYEVGARISAAGHPHVRWRGFHPTSAAGVFGAAAAVAKLRGLDAAQLECAFGLAGSASGGLFAFINGGGDVKRLHPGHAAREGMMAALQAERGMEGPPRVLESKDGYFHAFAGGDVGARDYAEIDIFTGDNALAITDCYIKPYACCRHIQPALDAMFDILSEQGLETDQVARIDVATYEVAAAHAASGWENMATAQLSFPFVMAMGLNRRRVTLQDFDDASRADVRVIADCAKVHVGVDAQCDGDYPRLRPATVRIATTDGRTFERYREDALGSNIYPVDDAALGKKFLDCAGPILGEARAASALEMLWKVDALDSIVELGDALAG